MTKVMSIQERVSVVVENNTPSKAQEATPCDHMGKFHCRCECQSRIAQLEGANATQKKLIEENWSKIAELEAKMDQASLRLRYEEALKKIMGRKQYSCECVGEECSCDFYFMQFIAEEALFEGTGEKGEKE